MARPRRRGSPWTEGRRDSATAIAHLCQALDGGGACTTRPPRDCPAPPATHHDWIKKQCG
eukprot:5622314-Pyramimonas_sp.AAC.1